MLRGLKKIAANSASYLYYGSSKSSNSSNSSSTSSNSSNTREDINSVITIDQTINKEDVHATTQSENKITINGIEVMEDYSPPSNSVSNTEYKLDVIENYENYFEASWLPLQQPKLPPAKSRSIFQISAEYEKKKKEATNKSAHPVFPIKRNGLTYFFKVIDKSHHYMAYLEAYANYRYRMLLPGKVAPNKTYLDDMDQPIGLCSKGIPNFKTLKDLLKKSIEDHGYENGKQHFIKWFEEYLSQNSNRERFIEVLAVAFYRCEDDLHAGNIAINMDTGELYLFDTDCSMWPFMHKFKGKRFGVDDYTRDPITGFSLFIEDIIHFPHLQKAQHHYFPGRKPQFVADKVTQPIVQCNTDNLYLEEMIKIVQGLKIYSQDSKGTCPTNLAICFRVWMNEMLFDQDKTAAIAALYIPKDSCSEGKNIIEEIVKFEKNRSEEFWKFLPQMSEFFDYLAADKENKILYNCLLNAMERNKKLEKAAQKNPKRAEEFHAAKSSLPKILESYNALVKKANAFNQENQMQALDDIDDIILTQIPLADDQILEKFKEQLEKDLQVQEEHYNKWINDKKEKSFETHKM